MRITLIAVGDKMPDWVNEGCQEYRKRLKGAFPIEQIELPLAKRSKNTAIEKSIADESRRLLDAIPQGDHVVALDLSGEHWSTPTLSRKIALWQMERHNVSFLIGGPDGFSKICLQRARDIWALSRLTLPHPLVRILFFEQLYRSWSILQNHPYHR
jgi:23S rRNA (pseudouridine1915-N3)-methyltransferase